VRWRSDLAAGLAARAPEEARHLVQTDLRLARRAGIPSAIGSALRASAALAPDHDAVELLAEAGAVLESSPAVLTFARVLLDLGATLRRLGRRVEAQSRCAKRSRSPPCAGRSRWPTGRARRPPGRRQAAAAPAAGLDALTPGELRVARLAAQGRTNREIAQALFITATTVADHLGAAYGTLASARGRTPPRRWHSRVGERSAGGYRAGILGNAQPLRWCRLPRCCVDPLRPPLVSEQMCSGTAWSSAGRLVGRPWFRNAGSAGMSTTPGLGAIARSLATWSSLTS
jgi:DNA-binding CsgD family transcriptional regulator